MADSLRDQLLKSGIVKQVREEKRPSAPNSGRTPAFKKGAKGPKARAASSDEVDLAKAYAIREIGRAHV